MWALVKQASPSWWQIHRETVVVTLIGVVATVVVAVLVAYRQRQTKILDWALLADEQIVTAHAPKGLVVEYQGKTLTTPRLIVLQIQNTGTREITDEDFRRTLSLTIPGTEIIQAEVTQHSDNMWDQMELEIEGGGSINVRNAFFNRGAWMDVRMIVDGKGSEILADCIFVGQTRAMRRREPIVPLTTREVLVALGRAVVAVVTPLRP